MDIFNNIFVLLILLLTFLALSAWFSGSETALFSLSRARLLSYKESLNRRRKAVYKLMSNYSYTLIVLIFCNMLVNTALTLTSDSLFHQHLQLNPVYEQLITIVFAVIVLLLFGEVAPKTIALMYSHRIADSVALPILFLRKLLFPLVWMMNKIFSSILDRIGRQKPRALNSEEYSSYIEMSVAAGAFSQPERELLESVFELRRIIAEEIMTARVNLAPIRANTSPDAIAERIKKKKQEFYPIISKDIDDAELLLSAKDFFIISPEERCEWQKYSTFPAIFIPANVNLTQVLKTLNKKKVPAVFPKIIHYREGEKWSFSFKRLIKSQEYKTFLWVIIVMIIFHLKDEIMIEHETIDVKILILFVIAFILGMLDFIGEVIRYRKKQLA